MSVSSSIDGAVTVVTMESENGLNVATVPQMTELTDALSELAGDEAVRAVVLTGAGDRAFCAGADIKHMSALDAVGAGEWGRLGQEVGHLLETMPQVTIAAVNGLALGGGCELALACDIRYASSTARFGQPEINLGIIPGWGGTQRLARIAGVGLAKELVLTGRLVGAEEAEKRGLVTAVADPVLDRTLETARLVASKSGAALAAAKALCNSALQGDLDASLRREGEKLGELIVGEDGREGLTAFLEKREPRF